MNASCSGEDAYARSKRKLQKKVCSQPSQKEPHKAKLFQDAPFSKQKHCHTAHVAHKPAFME